MICTQREITIEWFVLFLKARSAPRGVPCFSSAVDGILTWAPFGSVCSALTNALPSSISSSPLKNFSLMSHPNGKCSLLLSLFTLVGG